MNTSSQPARPYVALRYVKPAKKRATQYEELTLHTQWSPKNFASQGYFCRDSRGKGVWNEDSTRLQAKDWWEYRDPAEMWFRTYVETQARHEDAIETTTDGAKISGMLRNIRPAWLEFLGTNYAAYRYVEYGIFLLLCYAQREALSDVVATPIVLQSLDKDRHAQAIALYGMDLEEATPGFTDRGAKQVWLEDPAFQPTRRYIEELFACRDWGEILVAVNLALEPLMATPFTRLVGQLAARCGDPVTPVIIQTVEIDRKRNLEVTLELQRFLLRQDENNRRLIDSWLRDYATKAAAAAKALRPLFERVEAGSFDPMWQSTCRDWQGHLAALGFEIPQEVVA